MKPTLLGIGAIVLGFAVLVPERERTFEKAIPVSGLVRLDLSTESGGIVVRPGAQDSVHIRIILRPHHELSWLANVENHMRSIEANPPIEQAGNTIRVGYVQNRVLLNSLSMKLEITAPPETEVRARADSGGIRVDGINGPLDFKVGSGGIDAAGVGGGIRAEASSGGIRVRDVKGPIWARAQSGGITALGVAGSIDAAADSGGLNLSQTLPFPISARVDSGGVTVKLDPSGGYEVDASSDTGWVIAPALAAGVVSQHHIGGKLRGGGPLASIKAHSGVVTIH